MEVFNIYVSHLTKHALQVQGCVWASEPRANWKIFETEWFFYFWFFSYEILLKNGIRFLKSQGRGFASQILLKKKKKIPRKICTTSNVCLGYITIVHCYNDKLNVDAYLNHLNELFNKYKSGVHGWKRPWHTKRGILFGQRIISMNVFLN